MWRYISFVVLLLLGVAVAPSINANVEQELVEVTTEFSGIPGLRPHKISLSHQQFEELELLFDNLQLQLHYADSVGEVKEIYKDAIIKLDELDLLGGVSVDRAYRIATGVKRDLRFFSFVMGDVTSQGYFLGPLVTLLIPIFSLSGFLFHRPGISDLFTQFLGPLYAFSIMSSITLGHFWGDPIMGHHEIHPARGWVGTYSLSGKQVWNDTFYGNFGSIRTLADAWYVGVQGFKGIKLHISAGRGEISFIGVANIVGITNESHWPL